MVSETGDDTATPRLDAYVPRLLVEWLSAHPTETHLAVEGSMAHVDISGFTRLTDRLSRRGRIGAEELSDALSMVFSAMLDVAERDGADLIKWGGDAVLLLFRGDDHAARAARCVHTMRESLRRVGRFDTSAGRATLRMSAGIHSGDFDFFLCGDPLIHREMLVAGPAVSTVARVEGAATAGQIALSDGAAALVDPRLLGAPTSSGRLLRSAPALDDLPRVDHGRRSGVQPGVALPPPIRAHLLEAGGESEHRAVSVGFVRFAGTDDLLRRHGPHLVAEALDDCVRTIQHATQRHGVTFFETDLDVDGGKIMLVAGAPRSEGHDEERMLRAVRLIADRAGTIPLAIGVNRGHAFTGYFGPSFRRTYSVKGDVVNLAARLAARASPGQVLATPEVVAASHTAFATTELEPFLVKGKPRPVRAVTVGATAGPRVTVDSELPFVGRAAEVARLTAVVGKARARRGALVEVVGEPGIGKTRLVEQIIERASGTVVLTASCSQYEANTAYFPFRALLRDALGIGQGASSDAALRRLRDRIRDNAPHLVPWLPLLAIPLDLDIPPTVETSELADRFRKSRLEEVTIDFLRCILPTATVMVIEEAHFMDESSTDLLRGMEVESEAQPWAVVVVRREYPVGFTATGAAPGYQRIDLTAIDHEAAVALLVSATPQAPLTGEALRVIAAHAEGNPMFLQALALVARRTGTVVDLPESVEEVVNADIDRLDSHDRTLLRYAAVLGVSFTERLLREMLTERDALDHGALARLSGFVSRDGDGGLRFRHALIRDVAYAGLPFRLRRQVHDRVGRTLERESGDPEQSSEVLSWHFFHAGRHDLAWSYSLIAGERARAKYAHSEAIEFFERALVSAAKASGVTDPQRVAAWESLGEAREVAGLSREAAEAFQRARRTAHDDPVHEAELLLKEARIDHRLGKFTPSFGLLTRGRRALESVEGSAAAVTRSRLAARYSFGRYLQGRMADAITWGEIAVHEAEAVGDGAAMAYAYNILHIAYLHSGRAEEVPYGRLALRLFEELGDLAAQGYGMTNLAIDELQAGHWSQSLDLLRRSGDVFRRIGDTGGEANAAYGEADVLIRQGRVHEALPLLDLSMRTARAIDDLGLQALSLRESARAEVGLGHHGAAMAGFAEARRRFVALGLGEDALVADAAAAECLLLQGRADAALAATTAALDHARAGTADEGRTSVLRVRALAFLSLGSVDEADKALGLADEADDGRDGGYEHALLLLGHSRVAAARGDPTADGLAARGRETLAGLGVVGSSIPVEAVPLDGV